MPANDSASKARYGFALTSFSADAGAACGSGESKVLRQALTLTLSHWERESKRFFIGRNALENLISRLLDPYLIDEDPGVAIVTRVP